jgi:serine/threonine protein kinase
MIFLIYRFFCINNLYIKYMNLNLQKYLNKIENSNKNNTSKNNIILKFREKGLPIQEGLSLYNPSEIKNKYTIVNKKLKFRKLYPDNNEKKSLLTNFQSNISGNNTLGTESIIFLNIGKNYMLRIAKKNQDETLKSCLIHKLLIEKYGDNNEHILKIYEFGILSPEKRIYSILERCDGDLFNYIDSMNKLNQVNSFTNIIYKMTKSISYLHDNELVHLDIKLENFLYKNNNGRVEVKITDFGTTEFEGTVLDKIRGTETTIAPEFLDSFKNSGKYIVNKKADIFSLGVCFLYFFIWIFKNIFLDFYAPLYSGNLNKSTFLNYRQNYYRKSSNKNSLYENDMISIVKILEKLNIDNELKEGIYNILRKSLAPVEQRYNNINELLEDIDRLKDINRGSPTSVMGLNNSIRVSKRMKS